MTVPAIPWQHIFKSDPTAAAAALEALSRLGLFSVAPARPVLLTRKDAARTLAMSLNTFERHVEPHLRRVHVGRLRLVPYAELERFVRDEAA